MKIPTPTIASRFARFTGAFVAIVSVGAFALVCPVEARDSGASVRIVSPDIAETWVVSAATTHYKLFWDDRKGELLALLTFTNSPRVSRFELLREQQVTFRLPGVWLDEGSQTLYARSGGSGKGSGGRGVPVATLRAGGGFLTERVRPAAGTLIRVRIDHRGVVRVTLNASDRPLRGYGGDSDDQQVSHWEIDGSVQPF